MTLAAYGVIAEVLTLRVTTCFMHTAELIYSTEAASWSVEDNIPSPIFYHGSMAAYENCAECLWSLGILKALDPTPDGKWAYHFKFDCDPQNIAATARQNASVGPPFDRLLGSFITMLSDYGSTQWINADGRMVNLVMDDRVLPAILALEQIGFVTRNGCNYHWTDRVRSIMEAEYLWFPAENSNA